MKNTDAMFKYDIGIPGECKGVFIDKFLNIEKKYFHFLSFHGMLAEVNRSSFLARWPYLFLIHAVFYYVHAIIVLSPSLLLLTFGAGPS